MSATKNKYPSYRKYKFGAGKMKMNAQEKVRRYYNKLAKIHDEKYVPPPEEKRLIYIIKSDVPGHVLDVGTGTGRILFLLQSLGCTGKGIDISEEMIKVASRKLQGKGTTQKISFEVCNLLDMNEESKYDIVTAIGSLVYYDDLDPHFEKIHALLRTNGIFIFTMQNKCSIYALRRYYMSLLLGMLKRVVCRCSNRYTSKLESSNESSYPIIWYSFKHIKRGLGQHNFKIECVVPMRKQKAFPTSLSFSYKLLLIKARRV